MCDQASHRFVPTDKVGKRDLITMPKKKEESGKWVTGFVSGEIYPLAFSFILMAVAWLANFLFQTNQLSKCHVTNLSEALQK